MDSIVYEIKGKQYIFSPKKNKEEIIRIDFQKEKKIGDIILIDKILSSGNNFGQPYLLDKKFWLEAIIQRHGKKKKIIGMKYKAKKRNRKKWGHREKYTLVKIEFHDKN